MKTAHIIFPHHLFKNTDAIPAKADVFLIEEYLFFKQYKFHKQKIIFHRASMKAYQHYLSRKGFNCFYIDATSLLCDIRELIKDLKQKGYTALTYADTCDNWLEKRIKKAATENNFEVTVSECQLFINTIEDIETFFKDKKKYFQTDFYIHQRKKRKILIVHGDLPIDGKWSFDADNRLKYPKGKTPPPLKKIDANSFHREAIDYTRKNFNHHYGNISEDFIYPVTFTEAESWLDDFLENRFSEFGLYEDAIVEEEISLHHSLLTPMLNVGLLLPMQIIDKAITFAEKNNIPINSLEGFVRQIIGWREFIRAVYIREGTKQRTTNYWGFDRKIPASFYTGTTGIKPIDSTIKKLLNTGYSHHIERLMLLSNFMVLCEFDPDDVYQWFMEMYIDSYDWVMAPNVYGMGQFADGGIMSTKPYISGSNYIFKMSNYKKNEPWARIWDALFWRFLHVNRNFFLKNPRLAMLIKTFDKMENDKRKKMMDTADHFLSTLD